MRVCVCVSDVYTQKKGFSVTAVNILCIESPISLHSLRHYPCEFDEKFEFGPYLEE